MAAEKFMAEIAKARERDDFTDFELVCEGVTIPTHRVVLCTQSELFFKVCKGPYKEAQTARFNMPEDSLPLVERMVDYFYTGDYEEFTITDNSNDNTSLSSLQIHARMFALADKYHVEDLMTLSGEKYAASLTVDIPSVSFSHFLNSIPDVYSLTPDSVTGLREKATDFARRHLQAEVKKPEVQALYDEVAAGNPGFVKGLLDSYIRAPLMGYCKTCEVCPMQVLQLRCTRCGSKKSVEQQGLYSSYSHMTSAGTSGPLRGG